MKKYECEFCGSILLMTHPDDRKGALLKCSVCGELDWREVEPEPDAIRTVAIPEIEQGKADFTAGRTRRVSAEELTADKDEVIEKLNEKIKILNDDVKTAGDLVRRYGNWWQCCVERLEEKDAEIARLKHTMSDVASDSGVKDDPYPQSDQSESPCGRNELKFAGMRLAVFTRATGERCALIPTKLSVYDQHPHKGPQDVTVQEDGTDFAHIIQGTFEEAVAEVNAALSGIPLARAKKEPDPSPPKDDPEGSLLECSRPVWMEKTDCGALIHPLTRECNRCADERTDRATKEYAERMRKCDDPAPQADDPEGLFPECTNPVWIEKKEYSDDPDPQSDQFVKANNCSDCGVQIYAPELQCKDCFRKRVALAMKERETSQ